MDIKRKLPLNVNGAEAKMQELRERLDRMEKSMGELTHSLSKLRSDVSGELAPSVSELRKELHAHDAQSKMLLWEGLRCDGESVDDTRKRFYLGLSPAMGDLRLFQRGNAQLFAEFDSFCTSHDIRYFTMFGALLGAVRHEGFIPWDDDVDVCVPRSDLGRLIEAAQTDDRYRVSVVYDQYVCCKQVRFCYSEDENPCFVDLFVCDWTPLEADMASAEYQTLRRELIENVARLREENNYPWLVAEGDLGAEAFENIYQVYEQRAVDAGLFVNEEEGDSLTWGLENIEFVLRSEGATLPKGWVFPVTRISFEEATCLAPAQFELVLKYMYGDWLDLPKDMFTHFKHASVGQSERAAILKTISKDAGDGECL